MEVFHTDFAVAQGLGRVPDPGIPAGCGTPGRGAGGGGLRDPGRCPLVSTHSRPWFTRQLRNSGCRNGHRAALIGRTEPPRRSRWIRWPRGECRSHVKGAPVEDLRAGRRASAPPGFSRGRAPVPIGSTTDPPNPGRVRSADTRSQWNTQGQIAAATTALMVNSHQLGLLRKTVTTAGSSGVQNTVVSHPVQDTKNTRAARRGSSSRAWRSSSGCTVIVMGTADTSSTDGADPQ